MKRGTIKAFREYLNKKYPRSDGVHRNASFVQRSREYGDYLYSQDREQFNLYLAEALSGNSVEFRDFKAE